MDMRSRSVNGEVRTHLVTGEHVVVFGASGQTGRLVVPALLDAGHAVTAFVRSDGHRLADHDRLRIVKGDVRQRNSIEPALEGVDSVVVLLGRPARRAGRLRTEGTQSIVSAMQASGVDRVYCLATFGYGDGAMFVERASPIFRYLIKPLVLADTLRDHEGQEEVLRTSGLDWTILRTAQLNDDPARPLRTDLEASDEAPQPVSRLALADFIVDLVTRDAQSELLDEQRGEERHGGEVINLTV